MFNKKLKKELEDVKKELRFIKDKNYKLESELRSRNIQIESLGSKIKKIANERDELKKMVRDQTGADLLVNALEAIGMIKHEVMDNKDSFNRAEQLQGILARQAAEYSPRMELFMSNPSHSGQLGTAGAWR